MMKMISKVNLNQIMTCPYKITLKVTKYLKLIRINKIIYQSNSQKIRVLKTEWKKKRGIKRKRGIKMKKRIKMKKGNKNRIKLIILKILKIK